MVTKTKEKQKHLGRGLDALLGPITSSSTRATAAIPIAEIGSKYSIEKDLKEPLRQIEMNSVIANPYQPRTVWDEQALADLADSIKRNGVLQPILVRPAGEKFELIAGERRWRAGQIAGLSTIPAIVRQATDEQLLEFALIENIHRSDLNPIERAQAYRNYLETFSLTQAEASQRLGQNRSVLANYIRLLELPEEVKQLLTAGNLTMGHARAILAIPTDELKNKIANRVMAGRLSVREVERLVRKFLTGTTVGIKSVEQKPSHILDLEDKLTRQLGTKVCIETRKNGRRGRIVIEFFSLDEFDRITEAMGMTAAGQV